MSEVVGGPIDLKVCDNCPNRNRGQSLSAGRGKAKVVVDECGIDGIYVDSNGRRTGTFHESSTAIFLDDREACDLFANCEGPIKNSFLQRIGVTSPECPALENLLGGNPSNGDIVGHYARQRE